jgi:flagellar biosynthesis activator protein FlaF
MPNTALDVYQSVHRVAASARQLEAALLFKAARQLEAVAATWDAPDRAERLRSALQYNTRLWAVFQASMEDPENQLPSQIRVNVLVLIRFIDRRTLEVLAAPQAGKLQPLIEINRQIGMGLSAQEAQAATQTVTVGGAAA